MVSPAVSPPFVTLLQHSGLYAGVELRRLWQTRSGLMTLAATSIIWAVLFYYLIAPAAEIINSPMLQNASIGIFGTDILQHLGNWQTPELALYWILSLFLLPIFCLFFTANQLCSDLERGTLRFLSLRSSRTAIVLGRFAGQMLVQASLIMLTLTATLAISAWRLGDLSLAMLNSAAVLWVNLLLILLPFTALMSIFSALVRTSKLAVTLAIVSIGVFYGALGWFISIFPNLVFLKAYLLGAQLAQISSVQGWQTLQFATLPLLQSLVLLALATLIVYRRAV